VDSTSKADAPEATVALLTGGSDKPYVFGLVTGLTSKGLQVDLVGSDELEIPEFLSLQGVNFLNLRGSQCPNASFVKKVFRILSYYAKLMRYAATGKPTVFHILWNNKFEFFDRTLLLLYYKLLGKKVLFTAHNVNIAKRDGKDSILNRLTLQIQYRLTDHIFVHTERMKRELIDEYGVQENLVTVIPFGINNALPNTKLTEVEAKHRLGIRDDERTILFFGRIAPYKGLEYLIDAFRSIANSGDYRLVVAGEPDAREDYWRPILAATRDQNGVLLRAEFIPDPETEVYFKAADVLVLPYRSIFQSGVLFLSYSFGLPVLAAEVGSLKDEIVEGKTGFVFKPEDTQDLANTIERYFKSDLYANLRSRRLEIQSLAMERYSWRTISEITVNVYAALSQAHRASSETRAALANGISSAAEQENSH
jgi:D-inositol-3-phosphate glycosyltransferase